MIKVPTQEDVRRLSAIQAEFCVTIYLPTDRKASTAQQAATRLRNAIRNAEHKLREMGVGETSLRRQLGPLRSLSENVSFFNHQADGLALFCEPDGNLTHFRLPIALSETVHVNHRFHLKPLMQALNFSDRFYVLALSRRNVRLFRATQFSIEEVMLPAGIPRSLEEAMKYEDWCPGHQMSPGGQGRSAGGISPFTGHGADVNDKEDTKADLVMFFKMIDRGIRETIGWENAILIPVGLEYLHPLYAAANTYPHFQSDAGVVRSTDDLTVAHLHELVWERVSARFLGKVDATLQRYRTLRSRGLASSRIEDVLPAATDGRVEALLVSVDGHCWGKFDEEKRRVRVKRSEKAAHGEDLLDLSAVRTLLHGGAVYTVSQEMLPDKAAIAAVFRY